MNDEERAGRTSTSTTDENIDELKKIVLVNRRITVREVAEDLNILARAIRFLPMIWVAAKFVPKLLNFDQIEFLAKNNTGEYGPQIWPPRHFLVPETEEAHERTTLRCD